MIKDTDVNEEVNSRQRKRVWKAECEDGEEVEKGKMEVVMMMLGRKRTDDGKIM